MIIKTTHLHRLHTLFIERTQYIFAFSLENLHRAEKFTLTASPASPTIIRYVIMAFLQQLLWRIFLKLVSMMIIRFQIGLYTKASSAGHRFPPWSFPVSSKPVFLSSNFQAKRNEFTESRIRLRSFQKFSLFLFISQCHSRSRFSDGRWRIYVKPILFSFLLVFQILI